MKFWIAIVLIFFVDFATKWWAKLTLSHKDIIVWDPYISWYLAFNDGIAFSFPVPHFIQIFLTIAFLSGFLWWGYYHFASLGVLEQWGSVLVFAGALGNFWERMIFAHVTDFIFLQYPPYSFPIFNIADIALFFGVCFWVFGSFKKC